MKKINTDISCLTFILPVIYFMVQAILDKKYLFLILAVLGMIFWTKENYDVQLNAAKMTEIDREIWAEKERDSCIALTVILWVSYVGIYDIKQISGILSLYKYFVWIIIWIFVCTALDRINNFLIASHLKLTAGLLLAFFAPYVFRYKALGLLIQGSMVIVLMTYFVAMKRYLCRKTDKRKSLILPGLYICASGVLFGYTLFSFYFWKQMDTFYYHPLAVIKVHWIIPVAVAIAAITTMLNMENYSERYLGGGLFLLLFFYFIYQGGWIKEFSIMGILIGILLGEWLIKVLNQQGFLKKNWGVPVFYIFWIPIAYLLEESVVKKKYLILFLAIVMVLLVKNIVEETEEIKRTSFLKIFLALPYLILIFEYGSRENKNILMLSGGTLITVLWFVKVAYFKGTPKGKKAAGSIAFLCLCVIIPVLVSVKRVKEDAKYPEYHLSTEADGLSVGAELTVNLNGFKKGTNVKFDWGNGNVEKGQGNKGLKTTIKSGHLKMTVSEKQKEERIYHKFFLIWDVNKK